MILHFFIRFSTQFGQRLLISGNTDSLGNDDISNAIPLQYLNEQLWHGIIEIDHKKIHQPICYRYIWQLENGELTTEFGKDRIIEISTTKEKKIILTDTWNFPGEYENAFYSSAFQQVLLKEKVSKKAIRQKSVKNYTHEFKVKVPLLGENEILCLSGSGNIFNEWDKQQVKPLLKEGHWWTIKLNLSKEVFPVQYKYGIYNKQQKVFIKFEEGNNRIILNEGLQHTVTIIHDGFAKFNQLNWKGAGVAIPVFSLRSNKGFGTGEFSDLQLMVDWVKKCGLKLIQLLPVNDTTATHTDKDSYPYSAISSFALHPLLLNLDKIAGSKFDAVIKPLAAKKKQLNKKTALDYRQVMQFKVTAIRELYELQKGSYKDDFSYFTFFELNRYWLEPYAAFCFLRDKYNTSDFTSWKSNSVYNAAAVQRLVSETQPHHDEIAIHYFTQYHLHQQLKEATAYAHQNGIVIKGDIPIGICSHSVDAWMQPKLFHMDEQAGAPPDAFTSSGQNWGFPTYNWESMQLDNFTWWRKRFEQMNEYFDAFRIDHLLGFFRIWSIPAHAVEGILGRFVPAIPVSISEFFERKIIFDRHRYTQPYITEIILNEIFEEKANEIKKIFLDDFQFKPKFDTQRKIEAYFNKQDNPDETVKKGLYKLISNVILFEQQDTNGQQFHFRFGMEETSSFINLDIHSQTELKNLYNNYFYHRQEDLWRKEALKKLPHLTSITEMLVCGEDLGMVPNCVPQVMEQLGILSLEIQRMPKLTTTEFFNPQYAPYLSVVSPSTHDMSTIRAWWEEDYTKTKRFYNTIMGHPGIPPALCEPEINKEILVQHLSSSAMWSIFQLQDLLGISAELRRDDPMEERINNPANPDQCWNYRMHITIEQLIKEKAFNQELKDVVEGSGR